MKLRMRITSRRIAALAAVSGLLLQMAWATAHYPMLLQNLGTTENGVSLNAMVKCIHRAKQQGVFDKVSLIPAMNREAAQQSHMSHAGHLNQPVEQIQTSEGDENIPSDDLCTFSIALAGSTMGLDAQALSLDAPLLLAGTRFALQADQRAAAISYLASRGRAPPA